MPVWEAAVLSSSVGLPAATATSLTKRHTSLSLQNATIATVPKAARASLFPHFPPLAGPSYHNLPLQPRAPQSLSLTTQQLHQNMSVASSHHHHHHNFRQPCQAQLATGDREAPESDASPTASVCRREFHLDADCCDCGVLTGCRCSDPICDMVCERVDESEMEDGMEDQGYRQHV